MTTKRLKVLISAYACEPHKGSEPGVGWNVAREMARYHDIWVITRENNRAVIEAALTKDPVPNLHFIYFDLPAWLRWWKAWTLGVQVYYYLWQLGVYFVARKWHKKIGLDLSHHVTFVRYWTPSLLSLLPAPFIWGPVGGGEAAPQSFHTGFSFRGRLYERLRDLVKRAGEANPLTRLTARRSALILATTESTAARIRSLTNSRILVSSEAGLSREDIRALRVCGAPKAPAVRFISMGRLVHWKGFHLSLQAFAQSDLPIGAEYWLLGDGPERERLQVLATRLNIAGVKFFGGVPRDQALELLGKCHVLVHPSLHDSGGWVCLEAMAAGRPVICLDLGGPGTQVTAGTGIKIVARTPEQAVADLSRAMRELAGDGSLRARMGQAGQKLIDEAYSWQAKGRRLDSLYQAAVQRPACRSAGSWTGKISESNERQRDW